jgi:hypothetical protein
LKQEAVKKASEAVRVQTGKITEKLGDALKRKK